MKISIVIPCFNEIKTIGALLQRIFDLSLDHEKEIIVVDDGSSDGTREYLRRFEEKCLKDLKIVYHDSNRGKGAALRTGFESAAGDIIVIQDADLEYDPREYPKLLRPILENRADVVYGSRFVGSEAHRVLYFWHYVANSFITLLANMMTDFNLTDMEVGYKVFRREILEKIQLKEDRFGFEPEFTVKISRLKCRLYEVGISYSGRTYEEGKKINWKDGVHALFVLLKYGLFRFP